MELDQARQIIEALLFTSERPLSCAQIKTALEDMDVKAIKDEIANLRQEYLESGRSFNITEVAGGYQLVTNPEYAPWLQKLYQKSRKEKLSASALETLAITAYRQPITRLEIEDVRGVSVDGVLRSLLEKSLVRICGRKDAAGRPFLYGTSRFFLEFFGLRSLDELPKLEEFGDIEGQLPDNLGGNKDEEVEGVPQEN